MTEQDTKPDVLTLLEEAFDDPESISLSHARALKALREAHSPLTYAQLARRVGLGDRQTRQVINELERRSLIERHEGADDGPGPPKPDRFEIG